MFSSLHMSQAEEVNPVKQLTIVENDPEMNCTQKYQTHIQLK